MADAGRKGFGQKVSESITSESQKTYGEQAKEAVTDAVDKMKGNMMPDSEKSAHQSSFDSVKGKSDNEGKDFLRSAKEKMGMN